MSIIVLDTETTSLMKPFAYNYGHVIATEQGEILCAREYVIEQAWHNLPLFSSAYYADKRPLYIERMRQHKIIMDKFGYMCQQIIRDIKAYDVTAAYAFNAPFDEGVFNFNCDWYKCANPFDNVPFLDIRGAVHQFLIDEKYFDFCDKNERYTDSGNYSSTAETVFQYITGKTDFEEEHTALSDSIIEHEVLKECILRGAEYGKAYEVKTSLPRIIKHPYKIKVNGEVIHDGEYVKKYFREKQGVFNFTE